MAQGRKVGDALLSDHVFGAESRPPFFRAISWNLIF